MAVDRNLPRGMPPRRHERWREIKGTRHVEITNAEPYPGGLIEYTYLDTKKEGESKIESFLKRFQYDPE